MNKKKKVALGVGVGLATAAVAAGAGYYFYGSKNASANRKKAEKWAVDFKGKVIKEAKRAKKLDERAFKTIVAESMDAYSKLKSVNKSDLEAVANELKQNWANVEKELHRVAKTGGKTAKKVAKVAKKVVAKIPARKSALRTVKKKKA